MAVLVIGESENGNAALDERMRQELGLQNVAPQGSLARFAGPSPSGGWRVVSVWESEDAYRVMEREKLIPLWERMGLSPKIEVSPLESVRIAPAAAAQATR
jgi:hypothetical protein